MEVRGVADMTVTIPTVIASDPTALSDAATRMQSTIDQLDAAIGTQRNTLTDLAGAWKGTAADAAGARGNKNLQQQHALRNRLQSIHTALRFGGTNLAPLRQAIIDVADQAVSLGGAVSADGTVTSNGTGGLMTSTVAAAYTATLQSMLAQFDTVDQSTANAIWETTPLDSPLGTPDGELPADIPEKPDIEDLKPPADATDTEVNQWWDDLSPEEQQRLISERPEWIGNLDGVPGTARDLANRNRLEKLRSDPNLTDEEKGTLAEIDRALSEDDRQLLVLDFDGEHPKVAVALGNVDTADHVSVYVPGTGSVTYDKKDGGEDAGNDLPTYIDQARWLKNDAEQLLGENKINENDPDETVATVVWLGYEPPSNVAQAGSAHYADDNAPVLASFINGLDSSRDTDPHLTVLGHSYGSTLTSEALQRGTAADDVVFMGSPGLETNPWQYFDDVTPGDLHLSEGHVYIEHAKNDPIANIPRFGGAMPSDLPGFIDLSTNTESTPLGPRDESTGHSKYSFINTTALYNQAVVVAGLGQNEKFVKVED